MYNQSVTPGRLLMLCFIRLSSVFTLLCSSLEGYFLEGCPVYHLLTSFSPTPGYMISRYLIDCMGLTPEDAINEVDLARGHTIERISLIEDLLSRTKNTTRKRKKLYRSTIASSATSGGPVKSKVCSCYTSQQSRLEEVMFN